MLKYIFLALGLMSTISAAQTEEEMIESVRSIIEERGLNAFFDLMVGQTIDDYPLRKDKLDTVTGVYYLNEGC